ncbi:sthA, partial [Symbiodinium sp. CCMP2456]
DALRLVGMDPARAKILVQRFSADPHQRFDSGGFLRFLEEGVEGPKVGKATAPETSERKPFDLIVLGAGPAGVKAAIEAASRGYHVGVVEPQEKPTGAPTGAYSKCIREAVMAKKWTWPEIHDMVQKITAHAHENTMRLLHVFHIDVLVGAASFVDTKTVSIAEPGGGVKTFESFAFVVATGSKANRLPMIPFDLPGVYDSDTISQIDFIPKSMVVQGAGIIGLEYANMFAKLGARVVVVEFADKMLQMLDRELQAALLADLAANNVEILLTTSISTVREVEGSIRGKPSLIVETSRGRGRQYRKPSMQHEEGGKSTNMHVLMEEHIYAVCAHYTPGPNVHTLGQPWDSCEDMAH